MLKIAILSDPHLGFGAGTERSEDAFSNFEQALKAAIKEEPQPQFILLCGDIFHDKIPRQEILGKTIELFTRANKMLRTKPQILRRVKNGNSETVRDFIPPIIAIWGTHEKRHSESTNPVQILEKAGLLYCLHGESILVECGYDKIGIHGLSGVPEAYARDALKSWSPKPFTEGQNILMLHQNLKEAMPPVDFALEFADLPKDFITFFGHMHNTSQYTHPVSKKPIIVVGSTVSTQLQKIESETQKGYHVLEFGRERYDIKFVPIRTRPFYYKTLNIGKQKPAEILAELDQMIGKICKDHFFVDGEKPIVKIKLEGTLADGFRPEDLNLSPVLKDFEQKLILVVDKTSLASADAEQHSKLLEDIRDKKLSIDDIGLGILAKNLNLNIDAEKLHTVFHLLAENEIEQAEGVIEGKYEPKLKQADYVSAPSSEVIQENTPASENPIENGQQAQPATMDVQPPEEIQPVQQVQQPQRKAPDPTTLHLAESGMSLLGMAGKSSGKPSAPAPVRAPAAPQSQPQLRKSAPDPTTAKLAESGLSMLGMSSGPKRSSPASVSRPVPAPAVKSSADASAGLSMLASSDNKPKPTIRVKEQPGGQTIQKVAGQPHAKPVGTAPAPRKWKLGDEDDIVVIKKNAFDLKKWLNKGG